VEPVALPTLIPGAFHGQIFPTGPQNILMSFESKITYENHELLVD
jgi:hypothetical protein